jgi:hypothetical protein
VEIHHVLVNRLKLLLDLGPLLNVGCDWGCVGA